MNCTDKLVPDKYFGFIYRTLLPDGRFYIGQSTRSIYMNYWGSGTILRNFIKKNGCKDLKREILAFSKNQKSLDKLEELFIKKYKATDKKNLGCNIISGATNHCNPMKNPESVEKLRKYVLENHPFRGLKHSEEYKKRMSEILKKRKFSGVDNPMYGKKPANFGKIAINNGSKNRYISKDEKIPNGFVIGHKNIDYKHTEEVRNKLRDIQTGKKLSNKTRLKMKISNLKRWKKIKESKVKIKIET